jgi:hypothetical protein
MILVSAKQPRTSHNIYDVILLMYVCKLKNVSHLFGHVWFQMRCHVLPHQKVRPSFNLTKVSATYAEWSDLILNTLQDPR